MHKPQLDTAILLVAHGARLPRRDEPLANFATAVRRRTGVRTVETAYCELQTPDIRTGIDLCLASGAQRLLLYPLFLLTGKHVTEDLPAELEMAQQRYPEAEFRLLPPLGSEPWLAELIGTSLHSHLTESGWSPEAVDAEPDVDRK